MWGALLRSGRNATAFSESVKMSERNEKNKLDFPKILREKVRLGVVGGGKAGWVSSIQKLGKTHKGKFLLQGP